MSKIVRALMISAVATGTAVLVVNMVKGNINLKDLNLLKSREGGNPEKKNQDRFVDAEDLSEEERSQLTDELNAML